MCAGMCVIVQVCVLCVGVCGHVCHSAGVGVYVNVSVRRCVSVSHILLICQVFFYTSPDNVHLLSMRLPLYNYRFQRSHPPKATTIRIKVNVPTIALIILILLIL